MGFRRVSCVEANIVKTALVNMLLTDSKYELIANEVPFLNRKKISRYGCYKKWLLDRV